MFKKNEIIIYIEIFHSTKKHLLYFLFDLVVKKDIF